MHLASLSAELFHTKAAGDSYLTQAGSGTNTTLNRIQIEPNLLIVA